MLRMDKNYSQADRLKRIELVLEDVITGRFQFIQINLEFNGQKFVL